MHELRCGYIVLAIVCRSARFTILIACKHSQQASSTASIIMAGAVQLLTQMLLGKLSFSVASAIIHFFQSAAASYGCAQTSSVSSLYQCQPSSQNSDQVFIPNIPDFYFDHASAALFRGDGDNNLTVTGSRGRTFVFTVPAVSPERNCSGAVMSIQYCHQARANQIGQTHNIFDLITLRRNGLNFTVLTRDDVRDILFRVLCVLTLQEL